MSHHAYAEVCAEFCLVCQNRLALAAAIREVCAREVEDTDVEVHGRSYTREDDGAGTLRSARDRVRAIPPEELLKRAEAVMREGNHKLGTNSEGT